MSTEYEKNAGLQKELDALLEDVSLSEFADIREHEVTVVCCTKTKLGEGDEPMQTTGDAVAVKKVSDLHRTFIDAHYIVVVDGYVFDHTDEDKMKALLHSALMRIKVEVTESGIKLGTRKPDIQVFQATINRFGAYDEGLLNLKDCFARGGKRFASMITGDQAPGQEPEQPESAEDPPRVHAATEEEMKAPRGRAAKGK